MSCFRLKAVWVMVILNPPFLAKIKDLAGFLVFVQLVS